MVVVPYQASGPAAADASEVRLLQFGHCGICVCLQQQSQRSGAARCHLQQAARPKAGAQYAEETTAQVTPDCSAPDLSNVGLIVWQSAFVLADYLLARPPFGQWAGVRVLELGAGTGACGISLALAGATVIMTDLSHITPLTRTNVLANCGDGGAAPMPVVVDHTWGDNPKQLLMAGVVEGRSAEDAALGDEKQDRMSYDVVIGADLLYEGAHHQALLCSMEQTCAQHTQAFMAYRHRCVAATADCLLAATQLHGSICCHAVN